MPSIVLITLKIFNLILITLYEIGLIILIFQMRKLRLLLYFLDSKLKLWLSFRIYFYYLIQGSFCQSEILQREFFASLQLPLFQLYWGFPGGSDCKESACNSEDLCLIPGWGRSLEEEKAIHSSILAWRISWTEEPGELYSMGSQRLISILTFTFKL